MRKQHAPRRRFLGIKFRDPKLLEGALAHPSYRNEHPSLKNLPDFNRLEFFGDSVLNYVTCVELLTVFPEVNEGILSRFRSTLVSKKILGRIAREMKLDRWIKLGRGLSREKGRKRSKILADTLEALIAAVHEDQGFQKARDFILKYFRPYFNPRRLLRLDPNPKSTLQEAVQKEWRKVPEYSWKTTPHGIEVEVRVGEKYRVTLTGKNRRDLEEKGARELLRKLRPKLGPIKSRSFRRAG